MPHRDPPVTDGAATLTRIDRLDRGIIRMWTTAPPIQPASPGLAAEVPGRWPHVRPIRVAAPGRAAIRHMHASRGPGGREAKARRCEPSAVSRVPLAVCPRAGHHVQGPGRAQQGSGMATGIIGVSSRSPPARTGASLGGPGLRSSRELAA